MPTKFVNQCEYDYEHCLGNIFACAVLWKRARSWIPAVKSNPKQTPRCGIIKWIFLSGAVVFPGTTIKGPMSTWPIVSFVLKINKIERYIVGVYGMYLQSYIQRLVYGVHSL